MPESHDVTLLLSAFCGGDRAALDQLVPVVYEELRSLARRELRREADGHTLGTTGLVHEAYLKLARADRLTWKDRAHFFAVCAQAMRRVLIDHARTRKAGKRGGTSVHVPVDDIVTVARTRPDDLLWIDDTLRRLEARSPRQGRVVECRVFAGMGVNDTAVALGISPATVKREWTVARAWLTRELGGAA